MKVSDKSNFENYIYSKWIDEVEVEESETSEERIDGV